MERSEFCKMLTNAKVKSGIKTSEMSFAIKMLLAALIRFEKGKHNFGMERAIEYLNIAHAQICLEANGISHLVGDYSQLVQWQISSRTGRYSQRELAELTGYSRITIVNIETMKCVISVDMFLKIADVLGYTIKIVDKQ